VSGSIGEMKVRVGDVDIGYDRTGQGDPVLLVMGLGTTRIGWFNQFRFLKDHYDTTAFDNRGCGESSSPEGSWTIADMVADAFGMADAVGYATFDLLGVSMGGMIAQEMALSSPARIRSLTLVSTSPGGPQASLASPEYLEAFALPDPKARVRRSIELLFGSRYRAEHPEIVEAAVSLALGGGEAKIAGFFDGETNMTGFMGQLNAIMAWAMTGGTSARLGQITNRTLVLHGGEDLLIPAGSAKLLADGIPGSRLRIWDDAGHALVQEHADEVNEEILAHLKA
jgi:pimeloyl-ACP methyl ester carboxylesterase